MKAVAEQFVVPRVEDADKEKKKKRRSNRRPKHHSVLGNETGGEVLESLKNGSRIMNVTTSMNYTSSKLQGPDAQFQNEQRPPRASNVAFVSMPTMHINGGNTGVEESLQNNCPDSAEIDRSGPSKFCPELFADGSSSTRCTNGLLGFEQRDVSGQRKLFFPHLSIEAGNEALQKGEAFRAVFRVNAHNNLEAYCKIDGVPIDVLINGVAAQNRAIEGDIVLIKIDPVSLWTKIRGSNGSNSSGKTEVFCLHADLTWGTTDKVKVDTGISYTNCQNEVLVGKGLHEKDMTEVMDSVTDCHSNEHQPFSPSGIGFDGGQNEAPDALARLVALVTSSPSKRPTGKVVAILEKASCRDSVVGFLNVKKWLDNCESYKRDAKKNRSVVSYAAHEYIHLIPTDLKFPKMTVLVKDLPDCIKKRLGDGDTNVKTELVAAQIDEWSEESAFPRARVSHTFGKGGEWEAHMNAILYQNTINLADFSPESLSCLPSIPWEVPLEEIEERKDLRNLCVFTIDPPTATDLDDALSVESLPTNITRIGVHIADASYFVLPDTALDIEARLRSTSIYLTQSKLPMLPPRLSENICSLNPGANRLAFSILWDINNEGNIIDRWIGRTVIKSCCKLSYKHAQDIMDGLVDERSLDSLRGWPQLHGQFQWADVFKAVQILSVISKTLKQRRFGNGALSFESEKLLFLYDEHGMPYDSVLSKRTDSNFLVEEFMLLANTTAAEVISRGFPDAALLRRHPEPNMRKLKELEAFCYKHGLELDASSSGQFQLSLQTLKEKLKNDPVLFDILLSYATKPMQLASYFCTGSLKDKESGWAHYGLAVPLYTHFTSPIRRYPDIVVHRTMAAVIEAEASYMKCRNLLTDSVKLSGGCFTGLNFDKAAMESEEGKEALSKAALKHGIPPSELLADVASHSNERKLASRHVKDACDRLCMWTLLTRREVLFSEAKVLSLGPRFMTIYVHKFALERRICYDEVEGLVVEWLESTSTLVLSLCNHKRLFRRCGTGCNKTIADVAWVINPYDLKIDAGVASSEMEPSLESEVLPGVFPVTLRPLSTIPVALHAVGGIDGGPLEVGARLYMSTYFKY